MPISTRCPGCGKTIAAPDSAAGHKARCPKCGGVIQIPTADRAADPAAALAAALAPKAPAGGAHELAGLEAPAATGEESAPPNRATPSGSHPSRTIDRMMARTSPYNSLRLMSAIIFGGGIALVALTFLGGLAALVMLAISGNSLIAIGAFVGGLVLAGLIFVAAKTVSDVARLSADVGDRTRQMAQILEELMNRTKGTPF